LTQFLLFLLAIFVIIFFLSVRWFYRDPVRHSPEQNNIVVSPADGKISRIQRYRRGIIPSMTKDGKIFRMEEIEKAGLLKDDYYLVSIVMSPFDVHMNRAPISGQVVFLEKRVGELVSMRQPIFEFVNERVLTVLENETHRVGVFQIAAPIASSIKSSVNLKDIVNIGQKLGAILLGSQVNLIIPLRRTIRLTTRVGSKVKAGETILAEIMAGEEVTNEEIEKIEGHIDVQSKGIPRILYTFYLGNLWFASLWLRLAHRLWKW
jgi:phosphatidylserine decarboxylase